MLRLAVFLMILGFGSTVLFEFTDYRLRLLAWADDYQPYIGIGFGLLGILIVVVGPLLKKSQSGGAQAAQLPQQAPGQPNAAEGQTPSA
ncbi:hypothetical protein [Solihabitans fulvus]|uniref:hypothetical protein n=1 Tax=Solihabitans fulvus TaxID=1892852 RepID=UPI001661C428|nr:hypothetical protein [Solihabitans fulvus]